jgi:group I intron endonuclease
MAGLLSAYGVYRLLNSASGKSYIGSGNVRSRFYDHRYLLNKGKHHSKHLQSSWNKYGETSFKFQVLMYCSPDLCLELEQYWIDSIGSADHRNGYNVCAVAGSRRGVPSPQVAASNKTRIYDASTQAAKVKGIVRSPETRLKIAEAKRRFWKSDTRRSEASKRATEQWKQWRLNKLKLLDVYSFGEKLLDANDLDPVYVAVWHCIQSGNFSHANLRKWLLSYFCFYHSGTASWITDSRNYWLAFRTAAASKAYPRCPERRHFRGENARKSVEYLESVGVPDLFAEFDRAAYEHRVLDLDDVMEYVQTWVGFGPWIAFKVADMLERLGLCRIRFDTGDAFLFDSPKEAAHMLWQETYDRQPEPGEAETYAVESLVTHLKSRLAPPRYERGISTQEAETVLCKWKSYRNGRYTIGEDVHSLRQSLLRFARCKTSQQLLAAGKVGGLW